MDKNTQALRERDTALALSFLLLIVWHFSGRDAFGYAAMGLLLLAMIWPGGMRWPAKAWFGLSHVLGAVMSKVILGVAYFLLVLPVALVMKVIGRDAMGLRRWKNGAESVFIVRDHAFVKEDLENQF